MVYAKFYHPGMSLWVPISCFNGQKGDKRCKNAQEHGISGLKIIHDRAESNKNVEQVGIKEYWEYSLVVQGTKNWKIDEQIIFCMCESE